MNLSGATTLELAEALAQRSDLNVLVRPDGMLNTSIWPLRPALGAVACVDSIGIRKNTSQQIEGGVIRRLTGKFPRKLALVGGVIGLFESVQDAIQRHWQTDLGLEISLPLGWNHPICLAQYASRIESRNRPDFCWDPGKHSYASTHLVKIKSNLNEIRCGTTEYGGQEAAGLEWYQTNNCPPKEEWSYDMQNIFLRALATAKTLAANGTLNLNFD